MIDYSPNHWSYNPVKGQGRRLDVIQPYSPTKSVPYPHKEEILPMDENNGCASYVWYSVVVLTFLVLGAVYFINFGH